MDHGARQKKLRGVLNQNRLDVLLVTSLANVRYLCGFTGSSGVLILTEDRSIFFSDGRYIEQAKAEVQNSRVVIGRKAALVSATEWLLAYRTNSRSSGRRGLSVGIEGEHLTVSTRSKLAKTLGPGFRLKETPPLIEQARMVKDSTEIKLLRSAAKMGSELFQVILDSVRPGITENEVAADLEYAGPPDRGRTNVIPNDCCIGEALGIAPWNRISRRRSPLRGSSSATSVLYSRATVRT